MKSMKKKLLAGMVAGAVLTGIGLNATEVKAAENMDRPAPATMHKAGQRPQHPPVQMSADEAAKNIHETFGVDESEVKAAINEHKDFQDIGQAAMLSKISGKSFKDVLAMKTESNNWPEVGKSLGVTHEQIEEQMITMQAAKIEQKAGVAKDTAISLLKNGYHARDIECAGLLAKAAGKDVQAVLDMKKINNSWMDVASELGVDKSVLIPAKGPRPGHGPQGGPPAEGMGAPQGAPEGAPQGEAQPAE
ncbi:hypothetical protein SAMN02910356_02330 [Selenomonas sp. GACV-9]|uniref:Tat pathway signal sequence domain protein n=1 Tax=Selenomonas sp. GACV-9 TaxID=3158782 RepID=UPI0008F123FD|nr:hypothetical protein SAMN02910356_02330 [Selenomonas ruminantium]